MLTDTQSRSTGKERDSETGLDYFGARYYGSNMGRWMSPDWAAKPTTVPYANFGDPQSLNLYGYVRNNPLSKADVDGHLGCGFLWLGNCPTPPPPPLPSAPPLAGQAKKEFLVSMDNKKVGNKTVKQLTNVLTNETRDLTGGKPGELQKGKEAEANAIINNASQKRPAQMAPDTLSKSAAASPGREQDVQTMREAYFNRATGGDDPVEGRTYFGNSAEDLSSRPIGNSRQTVYDSFGPFDWGSNAQQYIYIYNDPGK